MFLGDNKNLENIITLLLAKHGELEAENIWKKIKPEISIQGIYRVLRKLQKEGVIIKAKQKYSLRIPWILDLSDLINKTEKIYLQEKYIAKFLPTKNKQKKYGTLIIY